MASQKIQQAFEAERQLVSAQVRDGKLPDSALQAVREHHLRVDTASTAVIQYAGTSVACKKGCNYCCHFKTEAGPGEIFLIASYIRDRFDPDRQERLLERAQSAQKRIRQLSQSRRMQTNIACALLEEGVCSVYEVRPSVCRKMHSISMDTCRASYENPEDPAIQNGEQTLVSSVLQTMNAAARQGMHDAELDASLYDLNEVLSDALTHARFQRRWKDGKKAFV